MTSLKERLKVEYENIEESLAELPISRSCTGLSKIELAGVAALIHNFYHCVEKILIDILKEHKVS